MSLHTEWQNELIEKNIMAMSAAGYFKISSALGILNKVVGGGGVCTESSNILILNILWRQYSFKFKINPLTPVEMW